MRVWRVQDTGNAVGKAGAVSPGFRSEYPGEAEMLVMGYAPGKAWDSVGIGRHGNFLQWGYSASPAKMTPAGRRLFLNCICYIQRFGNKPFVRIPQLTMTRDEDLARIFTLMMDSPSRARSYPPRFFPAEVLDRFQGDLAGMRAYYEQNIELVRVVDRKFCLDAELTSLGLSSNRRIATLEKLVGLRADPARAELAQELLLRYTTQRFSTAQEWQRWYLASRTHAIFSDTGGYKFYVVPTTIR